jgi:hypothetical protein
MDHFIEPYSPSLALMVRHILRKLCSRIINHLKTGCYGMSVKLWDLLSFEVNKSLSTIDGYGTLIALLNWSAGSYLVC